MIEVINLTKKYGNTLVLDHLNIKFPENGIVVIYGPSGCGKTTLLNCIAGLITYDGSIKVGATNIEVFNDKQMSDFRLKYYGFIFQDYKLFENETVNENILFPLKSISDLSKEKLSMKCHDLMSIVHLNNLNNRFVRYLSGGERQRVCIARALVNDPFIILADEPTGALDNENGEKVMDILNEISKKALIIIVSHDKELCDKYANQIIYLKDGSVEKIEITKKKEQRDCLQVLKNNILDKKQNMPWSFLFRHSLFSIKNRKWRTMFCNLVTSLGLIGVGLAISLSNTIATSIKRAYSSLLKESSIVISLDENQKSFYGQYAGSYYEANHIKEKYSDYVVDVGFNYIVDFESFFPEVNNLVLVDNIRYLPIEGISIRNVNEFQWLDQTQDVIYPRRLSVLEDDQIILGLTIDMINDICFDLQIERSVSSLSRHILHNNLLVYFDLSNSSWEYEDQQIFNVVGFSLVKNPCVYHTNRLWNQYVFEECMRFPTIDNLVEEPMYPWVMKKIPYFYVNDNIDEFLRLCRLDPLCDDYILEIADATYYPWLLLGEDIRDIRRVLFFSNSLAHIPSRYTEYFETVCGNIDEPIYSTNSGYSIYSNTFMSGFSRPMYFSVDKELLENTLETYSSLQLDNHEEVKLPNNMLVGHFSKSISDGVGFKNVPDALSEGRKPVNLDEIVISKGMKDKLQGKLNDEMSLSYLINQRELPNQKIVCDYKTVDVKIVGIVDDNQNNIYHYSDWTIGFFQSRIGISSFNLQIESVIYSVKNEKLKNESLKTLKKAFPQYDVVDPLYDVNNSVDEICGYLTIALFAFSIVAIVISIILLSITNYLHILETRKEIALARCIGINKQQSKKFLLSYSFLMCMISFVLSSIELIVLTFLTSFEISNILKGNIKINFNPLSILVMFIVSFSVSTISSLLISNRINKFNPIEGLTK